MRRVDTGLVDHLRDERGEIGQRIFEAPWNVGMPKPRQVRPDQAILLRHTRHPRVPFHAGFVVTVDENHRLRFAPGFTQPVFPVEKIFPAWSLPEDHPYVQAGKSTFESCYGRPAKTGKWVFSTNATYWMGKAGIPSIGFGPGEEHWAHTVLDQVPAAEVIQCADFYAMLPLFLEVQ